MVRSWLIDLVRVKKVSQISGRLELAEEKGKIGVVSGIIKKFVMYFY